MTELLRAAEGLIIERSTVLRPRDRRPVAVRIDISALPHAAGERVHLRWIISPEARSSLRGGSRLSPHRRRE